MSNEITGQPVTVTIPQGRFALAAWLESQIAGYGIPVRLTSEGEVSTLVISAEQLAKVVTEYKPLPAGTAAQPSWVPDPDPSQPGRVARITCDMLAWHLGHEGASQELRDQVAALSKAIGAELGS